MEKSRKMLAWVMIFFWASEYCHSPYFTPYLQSLGFASTVIGVVAGLYGFTQMIVRVPLGIYTDVQNAYKKVVIIGTLFTTVSSFWLMFAQSTITVAICRILAGFAASTWLAFTVLYSAYFSADEGVNAMASATANSNAGKLLAFVLGTVTASLWGYRVPLVCSTLTGVVAVVLALRLDVVPIKRTPMKVRDVLGTFTDKTVLLPSILAALEQFVIHGTVFSFTSSVLAGRGVSALQIGINSTLFTVTQVFAARYVSKLIVPKMGQNRAIVLGFICLAIYPAAVISSPSMAVTYAATFVCGLGALLTYSILSAKAIAHIDPSKKSTAMGLFQAIYGIGMTLGPTVVGRLASGEVYTGAYWMVAAVAIVSAAFAAVSLSSLERSLR